MVAPITAHSTPDVEHDTNEPWSPCRRHLMDLLFSIPVNVRETAHWQTSAATWDRIMRDHTLTSNWANDRRRPSEAVHWLFDLPVHLGGLDDGIRLIIPVACEP